MKTKRPASLNIRKARAQDKLDALEVWRLNELLEKPDEIMEKYTEKLRALESERDDAIANVPAVVGVKFQEKYVKLMASLDEDVREALKAEV